MCQVYHYMYIYVYKKRLRVQLQGLSQYSIFGFHLTSSCMTKANLKNTCICGMCRSIKSQIHNHWSILFSIGKHLDSLSQLKGVFCSVCKVLDIRKEKNTNVYAIQLCFWPNHIKRMGEFEYFSRTFQDCKPDCTKLR